MCNERLSAVTSIESAPAAQPAPSPLAAIHMDPQSQTLGASPSTAEGTAAGTAENAPSLPFPSAHHYSIEYPGYVNLTSVPLALNRLGGPSQVYQAFQRNGSKPGSHLELAFEPSDAFLHPLDGEVLSTNNLLLKIVKRRRKQGGTDGETVGEYTAQIVGSISKTARFRSKYIVVHGEYRWLMCSLSFRYGRLSVQSKCQGPRCCIAICHGQNGRYVNTICSHQAFIFKRM